MCFPNGEGHICSTDEGSYLSYL